MKTVEEVRRARLVLLKEELGTLVALNAKIGLTARDSTLSQIMNLAKNSKTGKGKGMGSPMARKLEAACGKEVGWMDTDPELERAAVGQFRPEVAAIAARFSRLKEHQVAFVMSAIQGVLDAAPHIPDPNRPPEKSETDKSSSSEGRKL